RLLKCCAHRERFLTHTASPIPSTALTAPTIAPRTQPLPPSRGEPLRPRGFSHRRRDAKSLIYWSMGGLPESQDSLASRRNLISSLFSSPARAVILVLGRSLGRTARPRGGSGMKNGRLPLNIGERRPKRHVEEVS